MQRRELLKGLCLAGLAGTAGASLASKAKSALAAPATETPPRLDLKVLVINYDPILPSEGGKRLHEVMGWTDPHYLADACAGDFKDFTQSYVNFNLVDWQDVDGLPAKKDGFHYADGEAYLKDLRAKRLHAAEVDYAAILKTFNVERRVAAGEIDEVWLLGPMALGAYSATMAGPGAYWCSSAPVAADGAGRLFFIMGLNYASTVGDALEAFGQRATAMLTHVYGSWEAKPTHAWNRFTLYDKVAPGNAACGNLYFSPTGQAEFVWTDRHNYIPSTCDDWLDYPKLTGKKRLVAGNDWGNGEVRAFHKWWFRRLPRKPGRGPDGKLCNWWPYIINPNLFAETRPKK